MDGIRLPFHDWFAVTNLAPNAVEPAASQSQRSETAHDILRTHLDPLDSIFSPRTVAVIGATEGKRSVGRTVIGDHWQRQGLGTELLKRLVQISRDEKLNCITAIILADNHAMRQVSRKVGFAVKPDSDHRDFVAEYAIQP